MKKVILSVASAMLLALAPFSVDAQTSVFSWDVDNNHSIQAVDQGTFVIGYFDEDGLTPNANTGLQPGSFEPLDDGNGNMILVATSWFDSPAQSDNWLIFGPITHPSNVTSVLTWEHAMPDNNYRDGYEVLVTSNGPSPVDFNGATVIKTFSDNDGATAGNTSLTQQTANLPAALMGGPVYIAFHHAANDQFLLFLDNFDVTQTVSGSMPVADFSGNVTTVAPGGAVNFTDLSTGSPTSWVWSFPGASTPSSTMQNPSNIVYPTIGCYDVTLTAVNSFGSDVESKVCYIDVTCPPFAAGFAYTATGLSVSFTNLSINCESYDWNFGDGNTSVAPDPINNYATAGTYTVTLTGTDSDCSGNTDLAAYNITVDDSTNSTNVGIEDITPIYNLNIFPNPSTDIFNLAFEINEPENVLVKVFNAVGQEVDTQSFSRVQGQFNTTVNLAGMTPGVYLLQVGVGNTSQTKRIVLK